MGKPLYHFILLFLSIASVIASAQTYVVSGSVTEEKNGQPMLGVHVAVLGNVQGTITDQEGNFKLETAISPPLHPSIFLCGF